MALNTYIHKYSECKCHGCGVDARGAHANSALLGAPAQTREPPRGISLEIIRLHSFTENSVILRTRERNRKCQIL